MDKVSIITVHYTEDTIGSSLDNGKCTMNAPGDVLFTIQTGHSYRTLLEPDILQCPLVAGRLKYRSVPEPCVFIVHFDLCYCEKQVI